MISTKKIVFSRLWKSREPRATGAWGFIVRDDKGEFVAAEAGKLRHLRSALQAETEALVAAVEGAAALGLNRVVFESDSKVLVDALNSSSHELSEIGVLLREARSLCILSFDLFSFKHYRRVCNKIAHTLAKFGSQAEEEYVGWADVAPDFVSDLVASESAVSVD
jgi:ribonuclease HI